MIYTNVDRILRYLGVSDAASLKVTAQKEADDFAGYEGPVQTWCPMTTQDIQMWRDEGIKSGSLFSSSWIKPGEERSGSQSGRRPPL